jgi:hypothetical protein
MYCVNNIQVYDKVTHKIQKTYSLIFQKNAKTRHTVLRVNSCFKVLFNLFISYYY